LPLQFQKYEPTNGYSLPNPEKNKNLSFFDKIFLFFFYSSKIILTFAYRKTINIYRIQAQTNTIIYTQTRTIMKKTFTKKTLVAGIAAALMTLNIPYIYEQMNPTLQRIIIEQYEEVINEN
jgi:hypothetical protein